MILRLSDSASSQVIHGVVTNEFSSEKGSIKLYLPQDLSHGDIITGTIVAVPKGKNAKELERNLKDYDVGTAALKKDLESYIKKQGTDNVGQAAKTNAQKGD